jgi:hypothetical protein
MIKDVSALWAGAATSSFRSLIVSFVMLEYLAI